ncbi:MAG: hypothetical protein WBJ13_08840, partial [Sedimentibacter sp.]
MQKNIDLIFTNAITDSMNGLSKGYNEIDNNQKVQYYYLIITNLKDALDVFNISSYKGRQGEDKGEDKGDVSH